jgi:hypothetical protein
VPSGKLFALEANAIGYVWGFYTGSEASYGFSLEQQFDGVRKAAYILAEKTGMRAVSLLRTREQKHSAARGSSPMQEF